MCSISICMIELYQGFNVYRFCFLSLQPVALLSLFLKEMILEKIPKRSKLSWSTFHTLVFVGVVLRVVLTLLVPFKFSFSCFMYAYLIFLPTKRTFFHSISPLSMICYFCFSWVPDRCYGTWKARQAAIFLASIDVGALGSPPLDSPSLRFVCHAECSWHLFSQLTSNLD